MKEIQARRPGIPHAPLDNRYESDTGACVRAYQNTGFSPRLALGITYLRTPSTRETRVKVHQLCGPHEAYSISCAHADMDTSRVDSDIYSSYPQPAAGAGIS